MRIFFAILAISTQTAFAAFSLADIDFWTGPDAGPDINEAALVIDWNDGQPAQAWGYRWLGSETKTGQNLLLDITSNDPRLSIQGIESGFVSHFSLDYNLDGAAEQFRPGWDGVANFWNYYVNNGVFSDPDDFTKNSHIVPPNTEVIPNGDPFADSDPGSWVTSNTGVIDRPLVNGSWDAFIYADGMVAVSEPVAVAVAPIPEPSTLGLLLLGLLSLGRRRRP